MSKEYSIDPINTFNNQRKTIGVLAGSLSSKYHEGIIRGATSMAKVLDYNIVIFAGGPLSPPSFNMQKRDRLFDLIDTRQLDGLIIPISSHTRYVTVEETNEFLDQFRSIPIINVGSIFQDFTNVAADYEYGFRALIDHYVNHHGYQRIALFRGPVNHAASNRRHAIYKKELLRHGLPYDEDLVVYGNLSVDLSHVFVRDFYDINHGVCDAIITMNDNTALGIIQALKERGISVPADVAISGSMDTIDSAYSKPKLTTIHEPLDSLGSKAVLALKDIFDGKEVAHEILVSTELVVRESCGCTPSIASIKNQFTKALDATLSQVNTHTSILNTLRNYCEQHLFTQLPHSDTLNFLDVLDTFEDSLMSGKVELLFEKFNRCIKHALTLHNVTVWIDFTTALQHSTMEFSLNSQEPKATLHILNVLNYLLEDLHSQSLAYQRNETKFYLDFLRDVGINLNTSFDLKAIHTYSIKILKLSDCFICVYDRNDKEDNLVHCLRAMRNKKSIEVSASDAYYDKKQLLPRNIEPYSDRYSLILFPLSYKNESLGYMVLDYNDEKGSAYENIQALISTTLKNELQDAELQAADERFRDIAHSTSDWLWETDASNVFTYSSASVVQVLGYTDQEMIGRNITELRPKDSAHYQSKFKSKERLLNVECTFAHKNNQLIHVRISATPLFYKGNFTGYRGVFKDITHQKVQEEKIKRLAYYDILTDLPNRTMFQEKLGRLINKSHPNTDRFATIYFDIDRFKYINDSMGHSAGDILLQKVADVLKQSTSSEDILARIGGDEFTIIIHDVRSELQVINTIRKIIENLAPAFKIDSQQLYVTMSFGIAMYPSDGLNAISLLKNADTAMYKAKAQGRNQFVFFNQLIEEKNMSRIKQEEILHYAIANKSFLLEFQPQVNTMTGEISGLEALIRMHHDDLGTIYPNNFIPLAEELGLIGLIDEWVLDQVCQLIIRWQKMALKIIPISVNLSATQLRNQYLVQSYMEILKPYKIDPSMIQIELTENALIANEATALSLLTQFKAEGFRIALDDFGTGHSSLTCVNLYPIDTVKIDRSFINSSINNPKSRAIISTVMHLAKELKLSIVAEGVETIDQYQLVKSLKCQLIQGYYFSKPKNIQVFENMILSGMYFDL